MTVVGYVALARRRAWILLLLLAAGAAGGVLQVHRTNKVYEATATYFVSLPATSTENPSVQANAIDVVSAFLASFQNLATKRSTAVRIADTAGLPVSAVSGHISSSVEKGTFYIDVTARDPDPGRARLVADAAADTVTRLIPLIQGTSKAPAGAYVTDRAVTPTSPSEPQPQRTITIGVLIGLVFGIALIALLEALDRTVRSVAQIAHLTRAPLLGLIPRRKGSAAQRLMVAEPDSEPYRALRTAVNFLNPDAPPVLILVTSPIPGDGKSTTTANLAVALAGAGERVLVVDADLRRGQLSRALDVRPSLGLSAVVSHQASLAEAIVPVGELDVLPSGSAPPNPSEILGSQTMQGLLAQLRADYDVVLIDAPPVLAVTDAVALGPLVDAVVLVVRHGHTPRGGLVETQRRLEAVGAQVEGVVLNSVPRSEAVEYYGKYVYLPT